MPPAEAPPSFLEALASHLEQAKPLIPMYIHLILSAIFPIYTGAHASLSRPSSAAKPDKKKRKKADLDDDEDDEDQVQKMEGMSNQDAIILPVTAGLVLMGLYFLIKWYGADLINLILGWYFAGVGIVSVAKLVNDASTFAIGFLFPSWYRDHGKLWKVAQGEQKTTPQVSTTTSDSFRHSPLPGLLGRVSLPPAVTSFCWKMRGAAKQKLTVKAFMAFILDFQANVTLINILSVVFGLATVIYVNTVSKAWFLTNLQGFAVSYSALQLMSPTTFGTGSLILGALFCYDIWAVFYTPFMVGVAKNLDQPIKLVFPRPNEPSSTPGEPPVKSYSMLGLGDIVLPGIMIGLALRFDLYMFYLKKQKKTTKSDGTENVKKAPYTSVTGKWAERFWTVGLPSTALPQQLDCAFPKVYFNASLVGYVLGMLTTLGVMSVFQHAQPALLYLVPGVLSSIWGTALVRGELKDMWHFTEAATAEQIEEEEGKKTSVGGKEKAEQREKEQSGKGLFERLWHEIRGGDAKKDEPKPGEKKAASDEQKAFPKAETKKAANVEDAEDGVYFSFSVERFDTARSKKDKKKARNSRSRSPAGSAATSSHSEGSEDAVVVSPADAKPSHGGDGEPRYRTRSTRGQKQL